MTATGDDRNIKRDDKCPRDLPIPLTPIVTNGIQGSPGTDNKNVNGIQSPHKINRVSPSDSRPATGNSQGRKSAWERAQEKFDDEEKHPKKSTKVKPFTIDDDASLSNSYFNLKSIAKIFRSKKFTDPKLERLYQRYFFKLNQNNLTVLMALICVMCVILVIFYYTGGTSWPVRGVVLSIIVIVLIILEVLCNKNFFTQQYMLIVGYILIGVICVMVAIITTDNTPRSANDGVWCTLFFIYMVYTLLPMRMRISVASGCLVSLVQVVCSAATNINDYVWKQVSSNY